MSAVEKPFFALVRRMPLSLALAIVNAIVFLVAWLVAGSFDGPKWSATLLRMGAQFNPLTLDKDYYRLFTHVFLHGGVLPLCINIYALLYIGYVFERSIGTRKFALASFLCGLAGALGSLYWNLFTVGLGMSGALSGMFACLLVYNIFLPPRTLAPMVILLLHFSLYAAIHVLMPGRMHSDFPAMFAGVMMGMLIGFFSFSKGKEAIVSRTRFEYLMLPLMAVLFLLMPRYQVRYFKFFKEVVAAEDTTKHLIKYKLTDDDMRTFIRNYHHWDEILARLNNQRGLPGDLAPDTFKLRQYISLRKQENLLKKLVVQREAYAYLDSIERLQQIMLRYTNLEYSLWAHIRPSQADSSLETRMTRILYDSSGVETDRPPAAFYRMVVKDSLGRLNGPFREYDGEGRLRVKGSYRRNKRDGVFLFYGPDGTCAEAGRFLEGKKFGKWETFHGNGLIHAEIFYNNGYFVNSVWDSAGNRLVVDGNGREVQLYPDGVVKVHGEYRHGLKEGTWYGRYPNGDMYYEEVFNQGKLITGKSVDRAGETFVYDESSTFPLPEGGFEKFQQYLRAEARKYDSDEMGHVKLSFRVMKNGAVADLTIDQSASPSLDLKAKQIVLNGSRWLPARKHGHEAIDAWAYVQVEFY